VQWQYFILQTQYCGLRRESFACDIAGWQPAAGLSSKAARYLDTRFGHHDCLDFCKRMN
jgi:hypothetical protein